MKRNLIMVLHTVVLFFVMATASMAQPSSDAEFFGIDEKVSLQDTIIWVRINDIVSVDLVNQTVSWNVGLYDAGFNIILSKELLLDFPSQALPLRNLKSKMKDESADILGLVYNGQEQ